MDYQDSYQDRPIAELSVSFLKKSDPKSKKRDPPYGNTLKKAPPSNNLFADTPQAHVINNELSLIIIDYEYLQKPVQSVKSTVPVLFSNLIFICDSPTNLFRA